MKTFHLQAWILDGSIVGVHCNTEGYIPAVEGLSFDTVIDAVIEGPIRKSSEVITLISFSDVLTSKTLNIITQEVINP